MRIALLTEGGYPYLRGDSALWCDRLLRGLDGHEFVVHALSRSPRQERAGWWELPANVTHVHTAPLWGPGPAAGHARGFAYGSYGRRERRRFCEHFSALVGAVCATGAPTAAVPASRPTSQADRFAAGLYGLAELAAERDGLSAALRSEQALRILEAACRTPGSSRAVHAARVGDLLTVVERLERALRPLSQDWYGLRGGKPGLATADLCHAVGAGPAALPGLLAKYTHGVPLLITEYGVRLREHYLASAAGATAAVARGVAGAPVRALLASFQRLLTQEAYAQAHAITPGNAHDRAWQERCGADSARLRTVYPGMDPAPFEAVGERTGHLPPPDGPPAGGVPTLVWAGRIGPTKDLSTLLHAFAFVRQVLPQARLRIVETGRCAPERSAVGHSAAEQPGAAVPATAGTVTGTPAAAGSAAPAGGEPAEEYLSLCRALAAQLFPPDGDGVCAVAFDEVGSRAVPTLADTYAAGDVVVLSSAAEGFPLSLVEAMFCGRATVSTDVGAVREVIGGTGLVVSPRDPRALADACIALLEDPSRAARLGAAARARALELFTVRQNVETFRGLYLELMPRHATGEQAAPPRGGPADDGPPPFACPAEAHLPGQWAGPPQRRAASAPAPSDSRRPANRTGRHGGAVRVTADGATYASPSGGITVYVPAGGVTHVPVGGGATAGQTPAGGSLRRASAGGGPGHGPSGGAAHVPSWAGAGSPAGEHPSDEGPPSGGPPGEPVSHSVPARRPAPRRPAAGAEPEEATAP